MAAVELVGVGLDKGGRSVLGPIDLMVESGELLAVVGPSGSGKTMLLRLIAGLEKPTRGEVSIDGEPVNTEEPRLNRAPLVFQEEAIYEHLDVLGNLTFALQVMGRDEAEREQAGAATADRIGLRRTLLRRRPATLSGGERGLVATGRALTRPYPRVLLLDEPLATADRGFRLQLREQLAALHRDSGLTILLATNDSDEAMSLADRVAVLADGRLHQVAAPTEAYFEPADTVVATTIGSLPMNLIPAAVEADAEGTGLAIGGDRVVVAGLPAAWAGRRVLLGLHPSELRPAAQGTPFRRVLHATVARVEFAGGSTFVLLGLGGVAAPVFTMQVRGAFERPAGSALELTWEEERTRLFDAATGALLGRS